MVSVSLRFPRCHNTHTCLVLCLQSAAFYSEPQLLIEVGLHNTSVQFETEGFPKAEIQWLGPQKQELEHQSEFKYRYIYFMSLHLTFSNSISYKP